MTLREKQVRDAEELLFTGPQKLGFAKGLFLGRFISQWVMPYPQFSAEEAPLVANAVREVREFLDHHFDPVAIDRQADIPRGVIERLGQLGLLGMTAPVEVGGKAFSQMAYCMVMEEIGARCGSTAVFINAHHSIGIRALLLFGTPEQKRRWLPDLVSGRKLAAFALTEPEAGSDAGNVQTQAQPSADGSHYILNGEKRYITNAAIAQVLTVMARTPVPGKTDTAITAFLVTPDMPGYELTEARMEKLGLRGTVTGRLAFHDMPVPKENILGPLGKGLKVALTVLDFGRTTFGACSTGAAKTALTLAIQHANSRRQFGRTLGEFELVKKKIARMASSVYAMEAMTNITASLIDRGLEDYMAETAMLKVFTTEALWEIVNDSFQIHGGSAYFTDSPLERMLRDTRINLVAEGANEILTSFIALVGLRGPGEQFRELRDALQHPSGGLRRAWRLGLARVGPVLTSPEVPVKSPELSERANGLAKLVHSFNIAADRALIRHKEEILERQYVHERLARAAIEIFASACVLSRWDAELQDPGICSAATRRHFRTARHVVQSQSADVSTHSKEQSAAGSGFYEADLFLRSSARRIRHWLAELRDNDDDATTATADYILGEPAPTSAGTLKP